MTSAQDPMKLPRGATLVVVHFGFGVFIESNPDTPREWAVWNARSWGPELVEAGLTYKRACKVARKLANGDVT